jgi:serine/threonine protein kinase
LSPDEIPEARQRFVREAQTVGKLRHDNIVTLHQFIEETDSLYLVMEFIPGGSLHKLIRSETPLTTGEALEIVRQVASALDYAHSNGIVHRDIKPGNILLGNDPVRKRRVMKVTDFGIARISSQTMTTTGVAMGTPTYMAPEQIKGLKVDAKADQFSLGVVAYEILGRRLPFTASDVHALSYQIVHDEPASLLEANPALPPEVERVIRRALAKNPEQRFASCGAFADALEQALAPPAPATRKTVPAKSGANRVFLAAAAALLFAAAVLYFARHIPASSAPSHGPQAHTETGKTDGAPPGGKGNDEGLKQRDRQIADLRDQVERAKTEKSQLESTGRDLANQKSQAPRQTNTEQSNSRTRLNPVDGLTYVFIPAGKFIMGCSPGGTECDGNDTRAEQIANGFWLGQTEVTQAAWK